MFSIISVNDSCRSKLLAWRISVKHGFLLGLIYNVKVPITSTYCYLSEYNLHNNNVYTVFRMSPNELVYMQYNLGNQKVLCAVT